ncbi:pyruvate formate lyase family protein [Clostridium cellulovorans]|uniref:Formate C-acetyltransferase n=1 Tax=Clostridium cellulovorans (strain ATCC 35296 / DSM 3052 / OCM 3 / 743B) TaxID=573061 RepID=D9SUM7_CLOC7|nr:pyruvate formate lyase family protein [Clostridium cellulovorans]ADL50932.1 Formate C-acetyltransferase [Clostridium cellulovorans 743B]
MNIVHTNLSRYKSTERVKKLKDQLFQRAMGNRAPEWFRQEELKDISKEHSTEPVIIRRAHAIKEMLTVMTNPEISKHTHSYEIADGELIVGVLPMASNGLGKVFPNYLTEDEKRAATITNRTELSLLGHNTVNYERLLKGGIREILEDCDRYLEELKHKENKFKQYSIDFYTAVKMSLEAVVEYAKEFSKLATEKAAYEKDPIRQAELLDIARICKKIPMEKPDTFHEALQSIYFYHVALHSSLDLLSLGRLDQVLNKFLYEHETDIENAIELMECFIIKCASRLNLTTEFLLEQDHMDYNAALGTHPYYLDQRAGLNNFLQNIIVGGKTPSGDDATNLCTYVILQAFENINLSTPGIYVRLGSYSSPRLVQAVARSLKATKNIPAILNDDVMIPAIKSAFTEKHIYGTRDAFGNEVPIERINEYQSLANDYCVDGCWEPILNGESDWTFGMINGMTVLECSLNKGATLDTNPGVLRGGKLSFSSGDLTSYEDLKASLKGHIEFFVDQSMMSLYQCYLMDEFVNPTPLFSALLGTCMAKGRDKSFGGTKYSIGGNILIGVPNMANTICAIKKWVFDKGYFLLGDVLDAMRWNFKSENSIIQEKYNQIKKCFRYESEKFGNDDPEINEVTKMILDYYYEAVMSSKAFADMIFLKKPEPAEEMKVRKLRTVAGYYGPALQELFGEDFNIRFTAGLGTFEQYPQQGMGIAACADRDRNDPLAPNFSPVPGTAKNGIGHVISTFKGLKLHRFAAGVMTDLSLAEEYNDDEILTSVVEQFIEDKGGMLTLSLSDSRLYEKIYDLSLLANAGDKNAREELKKYAHINVRVGGWQAPFITMTLDQQKNYIKRALPFTSVE